MLSLQKSTIWLSLHAHFFSIKTEVSSVGARSCNMHKHSFALSPVFCTTNVPKAVVHGLVNAYAICHEKFVIKRAKRQEHLSYLLLVHSLPSCTKVLLSQRERGGETKSTRETGRENTLTLHCNAAVAPRTRKCCTKLVGSAIRYTQHTLSCSALIFFY